MENKKLLKFLQLNLSELEELVADKGNHTFDDFEFEFLESRLKESKKLVQRIIENEEIKPVVPAKKEKAAKKEISAEPPAPKPQIQVEEVSEVPVKTEQEFRPEMVEKVEPAVEETPKPEPDEITQNEVELEEEEAEQKDKRLGDSFLKGKSVNELLAGAGSNLEHKLSNRPVTSIQASIGINDRFQYIRELFDGNAGDFSDTVVKLDQMTSINEAVEYLQHRFKWKKSETSLKFVNLVKRRFLNE